MGMTNSKQICFLSQAHTTGAFSGIPPAPDLHVCTNDRSGPTFTDVLHKSLVSFKHRKFLAVSLLKGQALGHWGWSFTHLSRSCSKRLVKSSLLFM